ncbi:MAG: hypothetical protein CMN77_04195 [Spirochaetaceae bacterium]|nr:hypothetical protein [Spirochaetaceae bacterium]
MKYKKIKGPSGEKDLFYGCKGGFPFADIRRALIPASEERVSGNPMSAGRARGLTCFSWRPAWQSRSIPVPEPEALKPAGQFKGPW